MAAVSAWSKPGAWALDAEATDAAGNDSASDFPAAHKPSDDFPSLAAAAAAHKSSDDFPSLAAAAKTKKKKKPQTISLAEFKSGVAAPTRFSSSSLSASKGLTTNEILALPTGPRERTAEELDRTSRGFGYSSYGRSRGDDPNPRSGGPRASDEGRRAGPGGGFDRDSGPSRADEIDDWGAMKRSAGAPMSERRERGGFFGDSQTKADESDNWISNKPTPPPPSGGRRINSGGFDAPRERRGGFDMFNKEGLQIGGADSDTWGKKSEENSSGMGSDVWGRKREENSSRVDSDTWARKREEVSSGGRPRIVLQPRTRPLADVNNNNNGEGEPNCGEQLVSVVKSKGSNPFGEARPREEVLKGKGEDWKKIDEKLDSMKIREAPPEVQSFGRKGFGTNGLEGASEDTVERAWRKPDSTEDRAWRKPDTTEERTWRKPDSTEEKAWKKPDATEPRAWRKPDATEAPPPGMEKVVEAHDN